MIGQKTIKIKNDLDYLNKILLEFSKIISFNLSPQNIGNNYEVF